MATTKISFIIWYSELNKCDEIKNKKMHNLLLDVWKKITRSDYFWGSYCPANRDAVGQYFRDEVHKIVTFLYYLKSKNCSGVYFNCTKYYEIPIHLSWKIINVVYFQVQSHIDKSMKHCHFSNNNTTTNALNFYKPQRKKEYLHVNE